MSTGSVNNDDNNTKLYCCYCGKDFSRKEHLERHLPSHTRVRPHRCSACQLSFARKDLLVRHFNNYHMQPESDASASGEMPGSPPRALIACVACSAAKTSCDKVRPHCARCASKGIPCQPRVARRPKAGGAKAAVSQTPARHKRSQSDPHHQLHDGASFRAPKMSRLSFEPQFDMDQPPFVGYGSLMQTANLPPAMTSVQDPSLSLVAFSPQGQLFGGSQAMLGPGQHDPSAGQFYGFDHMVQEPQQLMPLPQWNASSGAFSHVGLVDGFPGQYPDMTTILSDPEAVQDLDSTPLAQPRSATLGSPERSQPLDSGTTTTPVFEQPSWLSPGGAKMIDPAFRGRATPPRRRSPGGAWGDGITFHDSPPEPSPGATTAAGCSRQQAGGHHLDPTSASKQPSAGGEHPDLLKSESSWALARCNPVIPSGSCPQTMALHLGDFLRLTRDLQSWTDLRENLEWIDWEPDRETCVTPIADSTRESMLLVSHSYLVKALDANGVNSKKSPPVMVLPPSDLMTYFLRNHIQNSTSLYSLDAGSGLDPNRMLGGAGGGGGGSGGGSSQASTILLLLMTAHGASTVSTREARALSVGLIVPCRMSLLTMIDENINQCADTTVIRCGLLLMLLASWSGDKWLMNIAMGQCCMYMTMMRNAGLLDFERPQPRLPVLRNDEEGEMQRFRWVEQETRNRLVYNWVMTDQEFSLFNDKKTHLDIEELKTPLPLSDSLRLWSAQDTDQWISCARSPPSCQLLPDLPFAPSLSDLWASFVQGSLATTAEGAGPSGLDCYHLRLLLHPIQDALFREVRDLSYRSGHQQQQQHHHQRHQHRQTPPPLPKEGIKHLRAWLELNEAYRKAGNEDCLVTKINMVFYHLIALNATADLGAIEALARSEDYGNSSSDCTIGTARSENRRARRQTTTAAAVEDRLAFCVHAARESVVHCGQVFRLVRAIPTRSRPRWWSAAVYRATLILWAVAKLRAAGRGGDGGCQNAGEPALAIDQVLPADGETVDFLQRGRGRPVLANATTTHQQQHNRQHPATAAAVAVELDDPAGLLDSAMVFLDEDPSSLLSEGMRRKLAELKRRWAGQAPCLGSPARLFTNRPSSASPNESHEIMNALD